LVKLKNNMILHENLPFIASGGSMGLLPLLTRASTTTNRSKIFNATKAIAPIKQWDRYAESVAPRTRRTKCKYGRPGIKSSRSREFYCPVYIYIYIYIYIYMYYEFCFEFKGTFATICAPHSQAELSKIRGCFDCSSLARNLECDKHAARLV
jgi:hypothetical protein